jgi:butyrate kinase
MSTIAQHTILAVNPGSTSTKLAIWRGDRIVERETITHEAAELHRYKSVWQQCAFRLDVAKAWAAGKLDWCDAVVGVGGLLKPVAGGTYCINDRMLNDAREGVQGEHASNLGCVIAHELAREYGCPSYVVDPVSVDEFEPLARYSGHPLIQRRSLSHALNIHAAARKAAEQLQIDLRRSSFVIGHLGGGISIAAVKAGRIIDVNDAASDGPFSPERTGGLPLQPFIALCFDRAYSEHDVRRLVMGNGGLMAYLRTNSVLEVEHRIAGGDSCAREVLHAMAYQIAKEIGAMSTVLHGAVDAIVLTGGVAQSAMLIERVTERVASLARVIVFPGDDEMQSLAEAAQRVLAGEEQLLEY